MVVETNFSQDKDRLLAVGGRCDSPTSFMKATRCLE